jgi:hypothetical protein
VTEQRMEKPPERVRSTRLGGRRRNGTTSPCQTADARSSSARRPGRWRRRDREL